MSEKIVRPVPADELERMARNIAEMRASIDPADFIRGLAADFNPRTEWMMETETGRIAVIIGSDGYDERVALKVTRDPDGKPRAEFMKPSGVIAVYDGTLATAPPNSWVWTAVENDPAASERTRSFAESVAESYWKAQRGSSDTTGGEPR